MDALMESMHWLLQWLHPLPGLPLLATVVDMAASGGIFYLVALHYRGPVIRRWITWLAFLLALSSGLTCLFDVAVLAGWEGASRLAYVANTGINCMLFAALVAVQGNVGKLLKRSAWDGPSSLGPS
ncbi:phage holin family protein [Pseudomonas sp. PDNC002]|uniref:phage holin family protein n=1 Tax=Pseudomonas sp. PDNC002 TaxID=2811422 RepID=UPI00196384DE|nr:phage holin family protein [Pseudomonas sp. PDNC002]QRY77536.1 phage holin family protein [Pseudomonas sp. PDNC002]